MSVQKNYTLIWSCVDTSHGRVDEFRAKIDDGKYYTERGLPDLTF